ncbi:orotate phosphoribosyltransferase [Mycobacterium sp. MYCO198283]|uniref:orotate phosphoribosyltransferase n=1 Tax=Mycobacterium sp. MYCO198283 TaxID=2883505 RepID=UPI001E445286|nr:orotate phosphoribosyltransferase [Mycobacterium sp. MYCO198283]MCG5433058.1 orotate phosphoribosyltransferase [Mycobacterium sp. MYCO198283]
MPDPSVRSDSWQAAFELVKNRGYERRDEPFALASGQLSHDYIDGKYAVDHGDNLVLVARAVVELAADHEIAFEAVGGLTMGADPLAIAVSIVGHKRWFSVRKARKERGRNQWIEGTRFEQGTKVLLVDDVVSTGGSILDAFDHAEADGATVVGVIPMVDRGDAATKLFANKGVPYVPLITYQDLAIEPVGQV